MRKLLVLAISSAAFVSDPALAKSEYIDSAISAIESANGQARLDLNKGIYKAGQGDRSIIIEIPAAMGSTLKFDYRNRAISAATWVFDRPIWLTLRFGSSCARLSVSKLSYGEGGFLNGNSDQTLATTGPCRETEALAAINDFMRLSSDPADFFRGETFIGMGAMKTCVDTSCSQLRDGLPIRRAQFYNSTGTGGKPLPAFGVVLASGARVVLPRNGFLVLGSNSSATFDGLDYDLQAGSGSALLRKFEVGVDDGVLSGGQTVFRLASGSRFSAEEVKIEKDDAAVRITRGSLTGSLTRGSSVLLTNDQAKTSTVNLAYAKVTLTGMSFTGTSSGNTLSFSRGVLDAQIENAELWFTERNSIRLGYTNLSLVLGCPDNAATCVPVSWGPTGLSVRGSINSFSTSLVGGQFNIFNVGEVQLSSGQIAADQLTIDSTDRISPITGKINKVELTVTGQDLAIDGKNAIRLARAELKGNDLIFRPGQALPVGTVYLAGSAEDVRGGDLKKVKFTAGANLLLQVSRRDNDEPEITDGSIAGNARITMDGGDADVSIAVDRIRYYRGHGDALVKLTANKATYAFYTPSYSDSKSELGFSADVNVRSVKIEGTLAQPLVLGPTAVKASQFAWEIDPIVAAPYKIQLNIADQELVYAPISAPGGGTLCAPKVNLSEQHPFITGKIDAFASSTAGGVKIYDNALSDGIVAPVDDRGCSKVASLVCFVVGAPLGPVGSVAMAMICSSNLSEAERKLSETIRDQSLEFVAKSRFDFGY